MCLNYKPLINIFSDLLLLRMSQKHAPVQKVMFKLQAPLDSNSPTNTLFTGFRVESSRTESVRPFSLNKRHQAHKRHSKSRFLWQFKAIHSRNILQTWHWTRFWWSAGSTCRNWRSFTYINTLKTPEPANKFVPHVTLSKSLRMVYTGTLGTHWRTTHFV